MQSSGLNGRKRLTSDEKYVYVGLCIYCTDHKKVIQMWENLIPEANFRWICKCYCDESRPEPTIDETVAAALKPPRRPKKKGQRVEDLKDFPQEEVEHDVPREELSRAFGEGNWKSMPDEIFWQLRFEPARWIAEKHVVKVYVAQTGCIRMNFSAGIIPPRCSAEALQPLPWKRRSSMQSTSTATRWTVSPVTFRQTG